MAGTITPIFLFSLQRSGSTLTQRILATHPDIATTGEPWLLLPLLYTLRKGGVYAEYSHRIASKGIEEFCRGLPQGRSSYLAEIRELALRLYRAHAGADARYFLDKSPRYHVISAEIMRMFPDGKFIFLWRNPLAVISSHIETWGAGRWNLYEFYFEFYEGLEALLTAWQAAGQNACSIRYEDVVAQSPGELERLFAHLGLEFDASRSMRFAAVPTTGSMWDPTGTKRFSKLSKEPLERWKSTLASPVRRWWARRYLRWIGRERLAVMGYDLDALLAELSAIPWRFRTVPSDILRMGFGLVVRSVEPWVMRDKLAQLTKGKRLRVLT